MVISDGAVIDLAFPLRSTVYSPTLVTIPADHGYALFSAISGALPFLHGNEAVAIHPVEGRLVGNRRLQLEAYSTVTLRLPSDLIAAALPLAGAILDVGGTLVRLGAPQIAQLVSAASLHSRIVIIKGMLDAETLAAAARKQLDEIGVTATLSIPARRGRGSFESTGVGSHDRLERRTVQVRDKVIVGYAMAVEGLTAEESICLQEKGIGGRRRFGCGVFSPHAQS